MTPRVYLIALPDGSFGKRPRDRGSFSVWKSLGAARSHVTNLMQVYRRSYPEGTMIQEHALCVDGGLVQAHPLRRTP